VQEGDRRRVAVEDDARLCLADDEEPVVRDVERLRAVVVVRAAELADECEAVLQPPDERDPVLLEGDVVGERPHDRGAPRVDGVERLDREPVRRREGRD
jgi:hypothetical protein